VSRCVWRMDIVYKNSIDMVYTFLLVILAKFNKGVPLCHGGLIAWKTKEKNFCFKSKNAVISVKYAANLV
jgi:hypothetical protein